MSQLNSLLENSASNWKNMQSDAARLADKWEKTGLLEGFENDVHKNNMSMILENQAKQLVVEQSSTVQNGTAIAGGAGSQWAGVALPLVRKVFGQIASKEFVSVQPMNLPSGLVFFLDFQYGGSTKDVYDGEESVYGDTNPGAKADPSGGLYGAGRFAHSINSKEDTVAVTVGTIAASDVNYDQDVDITNLALVSMDAPADADLAGARAFDLDNQTVLAQYTRVDAGKIYMVIDGTTQTSSELKYQVQPDDANRGDFEDADTANQIQIPSIDVKMKSESIVAKTRKLKAQWTPEFAQDLNAYQALDAEAELTSIMSEYISLEIDMEILDMLIQDASAADEHWSARNNNFLQDENWAQGNATNSLGFFNTQGAWFQTLGTKMQKVSNKIHQKTLRGGANFCVISPAVATIIESIPGFASNSDGDASKGKYAFGIQKMGSMNSRYDVYKNPYMTEGTILMGYRGNQFLETGAVFAPYIPLIMTPLVYDPDTFTPRKGLLTRYAKKMIRPEFYGRVFVSGLNSI
jgi:hypothetical protein